ncbi:hypothetical protein HYV85_03625 [Candidatus Woesearchaeota archaeon]|nr:hypothetical protein [Candidatus Woesearchaeota archaeon]
MIVRFSASNIVAMIFFIPLLLLLGLIMAFLVPLLALIIAAASILFLGLYTFAKIGFVRKQQGRIGGSNSDSGENSSESHKKKKSTLEVKDYKVR